MLPVDGHVAGGVSGGGCWRSILDKRKRSAVRGSKKHDGTPLRNSVRPA